MRTLRFGVVVGMGLALAACGSSTSSSPSATTSPTNPHAVVVVSGFAAQSPFTTPTQACGDGEAAGISDTALRASLLTAGHQVYTAPAQVGPGQITDYDGFGAFSNCPPPLPEDLTVNALDSIDEGGASLSRFVNYLNSEYGVTSVDIVAHSMGGLFSRSGIKALKDGDSPVKVTSLTTLGTPWEGSFVADMLTGAVPASACGGVSSCTTVLKGGNEALLKGQGSPEQLTKKYLDGPDGKSGWNAAQGNALEGIPVTLFAGNLLKLKGGNPDVWPNDGLIALTSALAPGVSNEVLPHRTCFTRPDVHSAYFTDQLKLPIDQALTWDPVVLAGVNDALAAAPTALSKPNRVGCP